VSIYKLLNSKFNIIAVFIGLVILFFDFSLLTIEKFPVGIDGYYYVLQLNSLVKTNSFYFPTQNPVVLLFFSFIKIFINDSIFSIKIGVFIIQLFLYLGLFLVIKELTNNNWLALLSIGIAFVSGLHRYMLVEYLSQLGSISFLIWSIFGILKFSNAKNKIWLILSICFVGLSVGSHRSIIPIILFIIIAFSLSFIFWRGVNNKNRSLIGISLITLVLFFVLPAFIVVTQKWITLPIETKNNISSIPQLPFRLSTLPEVLLLLVFLPFCLWLLLSLKNNQLSKTLVYFLLSISIFTILITLNPFLSSELGFSSLGGRLRVLAFTQVALLIPCVMFLIIQKWSGMKYQQTIIGGVSIILVSLLLWSYFLPLPRGVQKDFLENRENLLLGLEKNKESLENNSIILANHGQQFLVKSITGIKSQQSYPKDFSNEHIYWLVERVPSTLIDNNMKVLFKDAQGLNTVIVQDDENWKTRLSNKVFNEPIRRNNRNIDIYLAEQGK
jgi:hypothetical protein